jgi:hypothetical protein
MTALGVHEYSHATDASGTDQGYNMARDLSGGSCPDDSV